MINSANLTDYNPRGFYGDTPLLLSSYYGHLDVMKYLFTIDNIDKEPRDYMNRSLLHKAAALKGNLDMIKYLIEEKQYNAGPIDDHGNTPLHVAAFKGQLDIVKYFVIRQNVSIDVVNNDGKTPLENTENEKIIDFLMYYKCPICRPWKLILIITAGNIFIVIISFIFGLRCKYFKNDTKRRCIVSCQRCGISERFCNEDLPRNNSNSYKHQFFV